MHAFYLPKLKFINFNSKVVLNFNSFFTKFPNGEKMGFRPVIFMGYVFAHFFFKFCNNGGIQKLKVAPCGFVQL